MKNDASQEDPNAAETAKALSDQQTTLPAPESNHIILANRPKTYKRRKKNGVVGDGLVEVVVSPEGKISKHEKLIITLLRSGRKLDHWYRKQVDGERMRTSKARGSILAIYRMTGESPDEIMVRLGLTDEEIARIPRFTRTVIWS